MTLLEFFFPFKSKYIAKHKDEWRSEWWLNNASDLARECEPKRIDLLNRFNNELDILSNQHEVNKLKLQREIEIEENELKIRLANLEDRKIEVLKADNDLRKQIERLEAKAHPSEVWCNAFTAGAMKMMDLIQPVMFNGLEKLKDQMFNKAYEEAMRNLNVNKKTK